MNVLVHKAVEPDKLSRAGKQRFEMLVRALINGDSQAMLLPKFDGVYSQFIFRDGQWGAYSRTGEVLLSVGRPIFEDFEAHALVGRRYNGELWLPGEAHQRINGLARKKTPQHLEVRLFDSFMAHGEQAETFETRYEYLFEGKLVKPAPLVPVAGKINVLEDLYDLADKLKHRGSSAYDGLILRDGLGFYVPGKGTDGEIIKIKPTMEADLRVVGTTPGIGNRAGGFGAFVVELGGGLTCEVGSGLTASMVMGEDPTGKIVSVEFLGFTSGGLLREPRLKAIRHDKTEADTLAPADSGED